MRNPLEYYKKEIEQANHLTEQTITKDSSEELSEEEIIQRNEFIMDFIVRQ